MEYKWALLSVLSIAADLKIINLFIGVTAKWMSKTVKMQSVDNNRTKREIRYLSSCMFLGPQTEWTCYLGWNWLKDPVGKNQTARGPAVGPRRTSIRLHPGHLALSNLRSGRSNVQWGHESQMVHLHVAWAHKGVHTSSEKQEITFMLRMQWLLDRVKNNVRIQRNVKQKHIFIPKGILPCSLDVFKRWWSYLPPLCLRFPDSSQ